MRPGHFRPALLFVVAFASVAPSAAPAADPRLVQAAEREGQLTIYGCDVSETPMQIKRFSELYPKIKVSSYVAGCWQIYNRHTTERGAGKPLADLFFATEDVLSKLDSEAGLRAYESPELKDFPKFARPAGSNYTLHKVILAGLTANTKEMKGQRTPTDWSDFAAAPAEWKDKVSFYDPRTSSAAFAVLATLHQNLGEAKAGAVYAGLRRLGAELSATTPAGVAKVLSGEKPIMFYILTNQFGVVTEKGAPLEFTVPKSGAVSFGLGVAAVKEAARPNAAQLFIDYMLSEGQKVVTARAEYALRNGAPPPKGLPALRDVKIMPTDVAKALADQKRLIAWWQEQTGIK